MTTKEQAPTPQEQVLSDTPTPRTEAEIPEQSFGIIDPDYARIFTIARIEARNYGYACLAHGSFTRDLDLLLVPWEEHARREPQHIVERIAESTGLHLASEGNNRPHGRKSWTLIFPAFGDPRWVDISAFPPASAKEQEAK